MSWPRRSGTGGDPPVLRPGTERARRPTEVTTDRAPAYPRVLDELVPEAWHVWSSTPTTPSKLTTAS